MGQFGSQYKDVPQLYGLQKICKDLILLNGFKSDYKNIGAKIGFILLFIVLFFLYVTIMVLWDKVLYLG